jgi:O-antigen/teichoic acid export membrane protein
MSWLFPDRTPAASLPVYDRRRARRSLFDTIAYRIASQVATVLGYVVLVRALRKEDFGVLSLLYSFIPLVGTLASLGLEQTLRRFQPEYLRLGNAVAAAWLVKRIAILRFLTNCIVLSVVVLIWKHVAAYFGLAPYRNQFLMFCVLVLLYFQTQILQLTMAAHMQHRYSVGSVAMLSYGKLICYSALALAGALTLRNAILADTIAYAAIYVFLRTVYFRQCAGNLSTEGYKPTAEQRKRLIRYGLFNNFNDAGSFFLESRVDNFFIAGFMNAVAVGVYSFYLRLNEMAINMLPSRLFDNIIQPMFFAIKPAEADRRVPQYFTFLVNMNLLVLWPILAFSVAYHSDIVRVLFAGKFIEHSWLLCVFLGFATLNSFATPVALVAQYEEKAHIQLLSKVFAGYNVLALFVLVPSMGLYGAALAIGSSAVLKNSFVWWHMRRLAVWGNAGTSIAASVALWGSVVAVCYAIKALVAVPPLVQLLFGIVVFACAAMIHVRGPMLCASDRELLLRLFQGREMRLLRVLGLLNPAVGTPGVR